jgi:hypothetical protein
MVNWERTDRSLCNQRNGPRSIEERKRDIKKTCMVCDLRKCKDIFLEDTTGSWVREKINEQAIEKVEKHAAKYPGASVSSYLVEMKAKREREANDLAVQK